MSSSATAAPRLIRSDNLLPATVEQLLRKLRLDRFRGNVQFNIKDGHIIGYRLEEVVTLATET